MTPHRERLTAPLSWWLSALLFAVTCAWIVVVISSWPPAVVTFLVVLALTSGLVARYGALTIEVDDQGLHVGPALLATPFIGSVEALHRVEYRARLGVDADARGHLVTRPYVDRGVLVPVDDPADPTPYWLVSSRHPDELAAAINAHRTTHEGTPRGEEAV